MIRPKEPVTRKPWVRKPLRSKSSHHLLLLCARAPQPPDHLLLPLEQVEVGGEIVLLGPRVPPVLRPPFISPCQPASRERAVRVPAIVQKMTLEAGNRFFNFRVFWTLYQMSECARDASKRATTGRADTYSLSLSFKSLDLPAIGKHKVIQASLFSEEFFFNFHFLFCPD